MASARDTPGEQEDALLTGLRFGSNPPQEQKKKKTTNTSPPQKQMKKEAKEKEAAQRWKKEKRSKSFVQFALGSNSTSEFERANRNSLPYEHYRIADMVNLLVLGRE